MATTNDYEPLISRKVASSYPGMGGKTTPNGDQEIESDDGDFTVFGGESTTEPPRRNTITVEEAIEKMGFGAFQILVTFFCGLLWLADAMELMILSVLSPAVECQWGLTNAEGAAITSVVFVGFLLGGLVWGVLSDIIGRKMALLMVNICILIFGVLSAIKVAPDDYSGKSFGYPWLLVCRFGVGFGAGGSAQSVTYYAEFLPQKLRGYCLVLIEVWWTIGSVFGALLALGVMNTLGWHWYLGIATAPLFLVLFLFPFVPESARFYLMKKKPDKAKDVLNRIAWFNRRACPPGDVLTVEQKESLAANQECSVSYSQEGGVSFVTNNKQEVIPLLEENSASDEEHMTKCQLPGFQRLKQQAIAVQDMFTGGMWRTTVLLWILWIGCGWIYYGAVLLTTSIFQYSNHCFSDTQNTTNGTSECGPLSDSAYIKIVWTAAAELPGLLVTIFIIEVFGRKKTMALEFTITMIVFLLLFVCTTSYVTTFFLFLIRAFATGVFQTVYVYTPEVYTTNIRASALGLHTAAARVGALLTPFNAQVLFHRSDFAAVSLYSASCLVMAFASIILPIETKGKSMKDGRIE